MSWWVFTDPEKTGTCERCKRPLAEHAHTCVACSTVPRLRAKSVLAPGNVTNFSIHSYKDHPPGMKHSSMNLCYCPRSAYMPAVAPVVPGVVVQPVIAASAAASVAAISTRPKGPRPPPGECCECGGCVGCTAVSECFRPPEIGCGDKCIVCYGLGLITPPAQQAVSVPVPVQQAVSAPAVRQNVSDAYTAAKKKAAELRALADEAEAAVAGFNVQAPLVDEEVVGTRE